jgi:uncharacterized membrane protein
VPGPSVSRDQPPAGIASADGGTSSGLSPRAAASLAFVRFHARQALRAFGAIWLAGVACWGFSVVLAFVSPSGFRIAAVLGHVIWAVGVVAWVVCLTKAWTGQRWRLPWLGQRLGLDG